MQQIRDSQINHTTLNGKHWIYTSFGLSRQILHFKISLYSLSSCWSFSTTDEPSICDWRRETFLLTTSNSSSNLFLSNLIMTKMWALHHYKAENRRKNKYKHNTSPSPGLSAAQQDPLDFFQPWTVISPVTLSVAEMISSHPRISFGYFPMWLSSETYLLQVSELGQSTFWTAKPISQIQYSYQLRIIGY